MSDRALADHLIEEATEDVRRARDARDAAYWMFTRTARGQPVPRRLSRAVVAAEERLLAVRRMVRAASETLHHPAVQ